MQDYSVEEILLREKPLNNHIKLYILNLNMNLKVHMVTIHLIIDIELEKISH